MLIWLCVQLLDDNNFGVMAEEHERNFGQPSLEKGHDVRHLLPQT